MKLDKEFMQKNLFWVLLAAAVVLWVASLGLVFLDPRSKAAKAATDFDTEQKRLAKGPSVKVMNEKFPPQWKKAEEEFKAQKNILWKEAWVKQGARYKLTETALTSLRAAKVPEDVLAKLEPLRERNFDRGEQFLQALTSALSAEQLRNHEDLVLKHSEQSNYMTWPDKMAEAMEKTGTTPSHFGDRLDSELIQRYKNDFYKSQFPQADSESLKSFLGLKGSEQEYFPISYESKALGQVTWKEEPSIEECWLAQEDVWVRREVLNSLVGVLRSLGKFEEVRETLVREETLKGLAGVALGGAVFRDPAAKLYKERPQKDGMTSKLFRNHSWEVELLLEERGGSLQISPKSTIKNINPLQRSMSLLSGSPSRGLQLQLRQGKAVPHTMKRLEGPVLQYGELAPFGATRQVESVNLSKDFELEELFDKDTSPIRRVLALTVGGETAQSHRTSVAFSLVPNKIVPAATSSGTPTAPPAPPGPGGKPNPGGGQPPPGTTPPGTTPPGTTPPGAKPGEQTTTGNGFNRNRYVLCNEVVRRLPFAFVIVVDQAHRSDVLAAVSSSKLRLQVQQVYWTHSKPLLASAQPAKPGDRDPPRAADGRGTRDTTPPRDTRKDDKDKSKPGNQSEADRNLIEMSVHGVAALYERYPGKAPATTAPKPGTTPPPKK